MATEKNTTSLANLLRLNKLFRRSFHAFAFLLLVWVASVVAYAVIQHMGLHQYDSIATNVLGWVSILFLIAVVVTFYATRILFESLVPIIAKIQRSFDQEGVTTTQAAACCLQKTEVKVPATK